MNTFQKQALAYLDSHMPKRFDGRTMAIKAIKRHPRPNAEAKRWVRFFKKKAEAVSTGIKPKTEFADPSDVQELMAKILNAHHHIDAHLRKPLQALAENVASGMVSFKDFRPKAAQIVHLAKQWATLPRATC